MRLTPLNGDQLELRSAYIYVRSIIDTNVRFVVQNILRVESLSEELLCENLWPVEFLFELLLIVNSPIKLRTRVKAPEIRMASDMVPMSVRHEHGCQRRQSWR